MKFITLRLISNKQLALLLLIPVIFYYSMHFLHPRINPNHIATGFIQYDQPSYVANSLEYKKSENWHIAFSMPYLETHQKEPIYFFPQLFLIGNLAKISPFSPTAIFLVFGFVFAYLGILKIIQLIELVAPQANKSHLRLLQILAVWGGGFLFLPGIVYTLISSNGDIAWSIKNCFLFDPGDGFWMLNMGRNFIYPMEALYHYLFVSVIISIYKKNYLKSSLIASILVFCHPFTGTIIAGSLGLFLFIQTLKSFTKQNIIPLSIISSSYLIVIIYNFYWLPKNPAHNQLLKQWQIDWSAKPYQFLLAYLLVLIPAIFAIKKTSLKNNPIITFLLSWLFVNLLLENHQYFINPAHQPLHFSHGYVWLCLFLLAVPVLLRLFQNTRISLKIALISLLLLDNASWFTLYGAKQLINGDVFITKQEQQVLTFISNQHNKNSIISPYDKLGYFNIVYNNNPSYTSHRFNTPDFHPKQNLLENIGQTGVMDSSKSFPKPAYWIYKNTDSICASNKSVFRQFKVYSNDTFSVFLVK